MVYNLPLRNHEVLEWRGRNAVFIERCKPQKERFKRMRRWRWEFRQSPGFVPI